jgi:hypothetical protein
MARPAVVARPSSALTAFGILVTRVTFVLASEKSKGTQLTDRKFLDATTNISG